MGFPSDAAAVAEVLRRHDADGNHKLDIDEFGALVVELRQRAEAAELLGAEVSASEARTRSQTPDTDVACRRRHSEASAHSRRELSPCGQACGWSSPGEHATELASRSST